MLCCCVLNEVPLSKQQDFKILEYKVQRVAARCINNGGLDYPQTILQNVVYFAATPRTEEESVTRCVPGRRTLRKAYHAH